jgi:dihydrolipoamide dehydrogenase
MDEFDLIVIGAGPGGYVAAIRATQLGLKVACIEKEPALGGTCLRVGCIPSKALLESSHHYAQAKNSLSKHGVLVEGLRLDLAAMQKRKNQVVTMLTKGVESLFRKNEITRLSGLARITTPNTVEIRSSEGISTIKGTSILIATGSLPTPIPSIPTDGERIITSKEALTLETVPEHLVIVGGGYIGLELGSVWNRLGSKVTVIEACERILPNMDHDLAAEALRLFTKQGIKFNLNTQVTAVRSTETACEITLGTDEKLSADKVLIAVGRTPNSSNLGLEELGVETKGRGMIHVNDQFATNIGSIYAIGDVIKGPMLAHKAEEEGVAFAEQLVQGTGHVNYDTIPSVVFTDPEIASIGKTEQELIDSQQTFRKAGFPYRANGRARATNQTDGFAKLLVDEKEGLIMGAHLIGANAGELINEISLAMNTGQTVEDVARSCHAHPTFSEIIKEAALTACERGIHS